MQQYLSAIRRRCGSARRMNTATGSVGRWSKPPTASGAVCSNTFGTKDRISRRRLRFWNRPVTAFPEQCVEACSGITFAISTPICIGHSFEGTTAGWHEKPEFSMLNRWKPSRRGGSSPTRVGSPCWRTRFSSRQFLSFLDPKTRVVVIRRLRGDSWAEIGQTFEISAHNAEVQFANAIKKARSRLFGQGSEWIGRGKR